MKEHFPEARLKEVSSYPFQMTTTPRHSDGDALGCLSRRALAEYHEESRTRFMVETFGKNFLDKTRGYRMLPVKVSYEYFQEARYPHALKACVGVTHIGTSAFEITMALFQDAACVCLSRAVTVHVIHGSPRPLTEDQRNRLQQGKLRAG